MKRLLLYFCIYIVSTSCCYADQLVSPVTVPTAVATLNPGTAQWNADKIAGVVIATATPASGEILKATSGNAAEWVTPIPVPATLVPPTALPVPGSTTQFVYNNAGSWGGYADLKTDTNGIKIGSGAAGIDYVINLDGESNDFVMTYMEDEDRLDFDGSISVTGSVTGSTGLVANSWSAYDGGAQLVFSNGGNISAANKYGLYWGGTLTQTSGTNGGLTLLPTYNQASGTASNYDIYSNRTVTAVGSGAQYCLGLAVGGSDKFTVNTDGEVLIGDGEVGKDYVVLSVDGETSDGTITYMEDEDRFDFDNDVKVTNDLIVSGGLGADSIVNGDFATDSDWTKGAGWTITGGEAVATGATGSLNETSTTVVTNTNYKLTFDATVSSGTFQVLAGALNSQTYTTGGAKVWYFRSTSTAAVTFDGLTAYTGTIDNVVLTEIEGSITATNGGIVVGSGADGNIPVILVNGETNNGRILYQEDNDRWLWGGAQFSFEDDGYPQIWNNALLDTEGFAFKQASDLAAGDCWTFSRNSASQEFTDTNGHQAIINVLFEAAQSGTAGVTSIYANLNTTSLGDGSTSPNGRNNHILLCEDGNAEWAVDLDSNTHMGYGTKHDGYVVKSSAEVVTTDGNPTTLDTLTLLDENTYMVEAFVVGVKSDGSARASYIIACTAYRTGAGNATLQGAVTTVHSQEAVGGWDATYTVSGSDLLVTVTGAALTTVQWGCTVKYINVSN